MHENRSAPCLIEVTNQGQVGGCPSDERVFIVGPLFGQGVFSATRDREAASPFTRAEAERLIAKHHWAHPVIVAGEAVDGSEDE